jgi:hypothetical protein
MGDEIEAVNLELAMPEFEGKKVPVLLHEGKFAGFGVSIGELCAHLSRDFVKRYLVEEVGVSGYFADKILMWMEAEQYRKDKGYPRETRVSMRAFSIEARGGEDGLANWTLVLGPFPCVEDLLKVDPTDMPLVAPDCEFRIVEEFDGGEGSVVKHVWDVAQWCEKS